MGAAATASSITVWLQVDAQAANWEPIVKAANAAFQKRASRRRRQRAVPDVGQPPAEVRRDARRRERAGRHRDGQHRDDEVHGRRRVPGHHVRQGVVRELGHWLEGLAASGRYGGKLYGVPYYAGSRVVTYRTDLFKKAGRQGRRRASPQFTAAAKKLGATNKAKGFSPVYIAGTDWYVAMGFVYDYGGTDRTAGQRQVEGHARLAEGDRRPDRVQEVLPRRLAGEQDDRRDAARTRTTSTPRATPPR